MQILEAYSKYRIPPNVAQHQVDVTAVGRLICDNWKGDKLDKDLITKCLLLHDMGNIIKFKKPFMGELQQDSDYWETVQVDFIKEYGSDVHEATLIIVKELELPLVVSLINEMRDVWHAPSYKLSWEARVCEFADCCVAPTGITTFENRLEDLKTRYHYADNSEPILAARKNGKEVGSQLSIELNSIPHHDFSQDLLLLHSFSL